jgi:hypothetical protein
MREAEARPSAWSRQGQVGALRYSRRWQRGVDVGERTAGAVVVDNAHGVRMPRRTNEFQQLVYLLQRQLASAAKVRESAMLKDKSTGSDVEVDIVIEASVGAIPVRVGIECNSESRKSTVEWVREMFGKHSSLPIDRTVLISKAGFTPEAVAAAQAKEMVALSLDAATDQNWQEYVDALGDLMMAAFTLTPTGLGLITFAAPLPEFPQLSDGTPARVPSKRFDGTLRELIMKVLHQPEAVEWAARYWTGQARDERKAPVNAVTTVTFGDLTELLLGGEWLPLRAVEVKLRIDVQDTPLKLFAAGFAQQQVALGRARNVFLDKERSADYVLVSMIGVEGSPKNVSLLFPAEPGAQPEYHEFLGVVHLRVPGAEEHAPTASKSSSWDDASSSTEACSAAQTGRTDEGDVGELREANLDPSVDRQRADTGGFCGPQRKRTTRFSEAKRRGGIRWTPPQSSLNL